MSEDNGQATAQAPKLVDADGEEYTPGPPKDTDDQPPETTQPNGEPQADQEDDDQAEQSVNIGIMFKDDEGNDIDVRQFSPDARMQLARMGIALFSNTLELPMDAINLMCAQMNSAGSQKMRDMLNKAREQIVYYETQMCDPKRLAEGIEKMRRGH